MLARYNFDDPHVCHNRKILQQDDQKGHLLTRPTLAATSHARPESAKTASSPRDAPCPRQGRREHAG